MVMAKRFKLRLSFPTLQLCRSIHPPSLPKAPLPYQSSRIFPKALDTPNYDPNVPEPPLSTSNSTNVSSKITPVIDSVQRHKPHLKSYKSSASAVKIEKKNGSKASICGSGDSNKEIVLYSGSFDSSYDFGYSLETISQRPTNGGGKKEETDNLKDQRSKCWRGSDEKAKKTTTTTPESLSPARALGRMMPVKGKAAESFVVVKRSEDPYEDFKRSMLDMILENHMFDATDLEELLLCFLSLNSRHHHSAILRAFAEICEVLFC